MKKLIDMEYFNLSKDELADKYNEQVERTEIFKRGVDRILRTNYPYRYAFQQCITELYDKIFDSGIQLDELLDLKEEDVISMSSFGKDKCLCILQNEYSDSVFFGTSIDDTGSEIKGYYISRSEGVLEKREECIAYFLSDEDWKCKKQFTYAKGYVDPPTFQELAENGTLVKYISQEEADKLFGGDIKLAKYKWVVEFNETVGDIASFKGKELTKELLEEIKEIDRKEKEIEGAISKFYFDQIENGEVVQHIRVDIGCGLNANQVFYEYMEEELENLSEPKQEVELEEELEDDEEMEL